MIVFALGLGSLETAVMYPVIALAYALIFDRAKVRRTAPLFAISAAYTVLHFWAAPAAKSGPYAIQIDGRIFQTLATYVTHVLGPQQLAHFHWDWPAWLTIAGTAIIGAGVIIAIVVAGRIGLFGLAWFLALLVPMLLLPDHVEDYALTGPAMGVAMILAGALARRPPVIIPVAVLYLAISLPAAWEVTSWQVEHSRLAGDLVRGVVAYDRAHPGKQLLITGLSTEQFYAGFADRPFETFGLQNVYGGLAKQVRSAVADRSRLLYGALRSRARSSRLSHPGTHSAAGFTGRSNLSEDAATVPASSDKYISTMPRRKIIEKWLSKTADFASH